MEKQISIALSLLFSVLLFFSCGAKPVTPNDNKVKYPNTIFAYPDEPGKKVIKGAEFDNPDYLLN